MSLITTGTALLMSAVLTLTSVSGAVPVPEPSHPVADGAGEIIESYLQEQKLTEKQISVGWKDLTSGEEYFYNGDGLFYGASLYKVALNMYFAQRVAAGEMTWETRISDGMLDTLMTGSLEESNNSYSYSLTRYFGSYRKFRIATAYLYDMDPQETMADRRYLRDSWITARRMIACLQTLYDSPEEFPRVTDHLLLAQPGRYFRMFEDRWPIAQKYGYYRISYLQLSTAGIVFVPDRPFLLVVLTNGAPMAEENISRLCVLMGDYALSLSENPPASTD